MWKQYSCQLGTLSCSYFIENFEEIQSQIGNFRAPSMVHTINYMRDKPEPTIDPRDFLLHRYDLLSIRMECTVSNSVIIITYFIQPSLDY